MVRVQDKPENSCLSCRSQLQFFWGNNTPREWLEARAVSLDCGELSPQSLLFRGTLIGLSFVA